MKRVFDLVISFCALALLLPVIFLVSIGILADSPGSVFFRQKRLGKNGQPFNIYKFRTMFKGAPDIRNSDGSATAVMDDPRITGIGKFLRKTSIDEIPQFINVLLGQMSLVGPRPDQVDQLQYYTEEEKIKLTIKPGITGLAQINGRNGIPWSERKRFDILYVEKQSFGLDLIILVKTIFLVVARKGIYVSR